MKSAERGGRSALVLISMFKGSSSRCWDAIASQISGINICDVYIDAPSIEDVDVSKKMNVAHLVFDILIRMMMFRVTLVMKCNEVALVLVILACTNEMK